MKVSIITVCRNAEKSIEATLKSVAMQTYSEIEYIIIDGKSSDKTLGVIDRYKENISKIISEPDKGIYDAMNKGIALAKGDVIIFLNANDTFFALDVLSKAIELFNKTGSDIIYGDAMMTGKHKNGGHIVKYDRINKWFLLRDTICHQAIFVKKKLYDDIGKFNLKFKIAADYEWLLRALIKYKANSAYLNIAVCNYSLDGISNDPKNRLATLMEYDEISKMYFGNFLPLAKKSYNYLLAFAYKVYSSFKKKSK